MSTTRFIKFMIFIFSSSLLFAEEGPSIKEPPKLLKSQEAFIPKGTFYPADEVTVVLLIDVSEDGKVSSVKVQKGVGDPFDTSALKAAEAFVFSPAILTDGTKVPVSITFQMKFTKPVIEKAPVTIEGRLLERGTRVPISDVTILAKDKDKELGKTTSGKDGRFLITVKAEKFTFFALPAGFQKMEVEIEAKAGETRQETYFLEENSSGFETTVRSDRVQREVTKRVLGEEIIEILPGTQGDTLKVVQNLPGVARPSFGGGAPVLRGSSPGDSRVYLEGQEIPLLYHFGGLRSTFQSTFLEQVEFIPGNFNAYYGRSTGGVIDVRVRDLSRDLFRGKVDLNLYDAGFALETPVAENLSVGMAFRRSYVDAILGAVIPEDSAITFSSAPRFYDYQFIVDYQPKDKHKLKLLYFGSLDSLKSIFSNPVENNPEVRGQLAVRTMFHNAQLLYESDLLENLSQESSVVFGYQQFETSTGPNLYFDLDVKRLSFRSSWEYVPFSWLRARAGIDNRWDFVKISLKSPLRPLEGESPIPLSSGDFVTVDTDSVVYEPAFFTTLSFEPIKNFFIDPSLRIDWYRLIKSWTFDPRIMFRYLFPSKTEVKMGVGLYQQPPSPDQSAKEGGNPDLKPIKSVHTSLGVVQEITSTTNIELTGFYKKLTNVVARNDDWFADRTKPPYSNSGTGEIYGLELLLKSQILQSFTGWLSYTFQRSFRKDSQEKATRPFDFDQPHILTALGTYELGRGWSSGFRFRLVSGNPSTAVEKVVFNTNSGTFVPQYGEPNSERLATFHQLDLRVDKLWTFDYWKLRLYLDVQNVYNRKNPEGLSYNYDYSKSEAISGLPILPVIGLIGEW